VEPPFVIVFLHSMCNSTLIQQSELQQLSWLKGESALNTNKGHANCYSWKFDWLTVNKRLLFLIFAQLLPSVWTNFLTEPFLQIFYFLFLTSKQMVQVSLSYFLLRISMKRKYNLKRLVPSKHSFKEMKKTGLLSIT